MELKYSDGEKEKILNIYYRMQSKNYDIMTFGDFLNDLTKKELDKNFDEIDLRKHEEEINFLNLLSNLDYTLFRAYIFENKDYSDYYLNNNLLFIKKKDDSFFPLSKLEVVLYKPEDEKIDGRLASLWLSSIDYKLEKNEINQNENLNDTKKVLLEYFIQNAKKINENNISKIVLNESNIFSKTYLKELGFVNYQTLFEKIKNKFLKNDEPYPYLLNLK